MTTKSRKISEVQMQKEMLENTYKNLTKDLLIALLMSSSAL